MKNTTWRIIAFITLFLFAVGLGYSIIFAKGFYAGSLFTVQEGIKLIRMANVDFNIPAERIAGLIASYHNTAYWKEFGATAMDIKNYSQYCITSPL